MKKEFQFVDKRFELEMGVTAEPEGDFLKCPGTVFHSQQAHKGVFKLTKVAWETVNRKAQESARPLDEKLAEGCVDVLRAELYIRPIPDGFSYVVDHRFFDKPPGY
ncbi:MAG: hypothetical protein L0387_07040 [Acidobacteria bacterium]|nr:hypothetical protein [Acidobacteriota bacterium]MCI0724429.1 hypothetical protein [Acidobacteriota bacterium]